MQDFIDNNAPAEEMLFKDAWLDQVVFLRNMAKCYLAADSVEVVGSHMTKSVCLPVVQIKRCGLTVTMRGNFYNWAFSVESRYEADVGDLVAERSSVVSADLCEGFPEDLIFGPIGRDAKKFTCHVWEPLPPDIFLWCVGLPYRRSN